MFCNQCGTQVPENTTVCPNCGANIGSTPAIQNMSVGQAAQPAQNTGMGQIPQQPAQNIGAGQVPQQPVQNIGMGQVPQQNAGMGTAYGQPGMQQPNPQMYQGVPMPGYGQPAAPKANPLAFITASHPGEPFPLKGMFSVKTLLSKITTIDLIGAVAALVMFISVFLPFVSAYGESVSMFQFSDAADIKTTWLVIVLSLGALVLYVLRMEMLGFLVSSLNIAVFVHMWTVGAVLKSFGGHFGVGFYFYLLTTIAAVIAPFVWGRIKKN